MTDVRDMIFFNNHHNRNLIFQGDFYDYTTAAFFFVLSHFLIHHCIVIGIRRSFYLFRVHEHDLKLNSTMGYDLK